MKEATVRRLAVLLLAIGLAAAGCANPPDPATPSGRPATTASAPAASEWPVLGAGRRPVLGADLYALSDYPAAVVRADGRRVLSYVKHVLKADAVGIVWDFYAASDHSDAVKATGGTLSARDVGILTRIAARDHLLVEYRPVILVPGRRSNPWAGLIVPSDPVRWFSSYYRAELPYLKLAQRLGVREFVTETELHKLNDSPLWPSFLARVSHVYHGVVSYAAWDGDYFAAAPGTPVQRGTPLVHMLPVPYLGMDMYWHMHLRAAATSAQVTAAWEALFANVPAPELRRTAVDETGIQARAGAYADPPDLTLPGRRSERVQVNWFTAACATVRRYHMRGVFFWKVDLTDNPAHPARSLSTFEGRKGAAAISECARILY
jgi:hypothetical protein